MKYPHAQLLGEDFDNMWDPANIYVHEGMRAIFVEGIMKLTLKKKHWWRVQRTAHVHPEMQMAA